MSPEQFIAALDRLDISQVQAARLLGVAERTVRMWISGDRGVPGPVAAFLTYLVRTQSSGAEANAVVRGSDPVKSRGT